MCQSEERKIKRSARKEGEGEKQGEKKGGKKEGQVRKNENGVSYKPASDWL